MKRVIFVLMFLMLSSCVFAMDDPIRVKASTGNEVKIYVRALEGGPFLNTDKEIVGESGIVEMGPFFTLNKPIVNLQILIIKGSEKILDEKIMNYNTNASSGIDCSGSGCEVAEEEFEIEEEEVVEVENETSVENETIVVGDGLNIVEKFKRIALTGKAIFSKDDGSVNWGYSVGSFVFLLCLIVFVFGILAHGKSKHKDVLDEDEKELQYMEKKVKETEEKIKGVKDKKDKKLKIENAKKKLAEEETELRELEGGGDESKIEAQKDVVEKVEDKVEDAKNQED